MPKSKSPPSKADVVTRLLSRERGASVPEMVKATSWKPHSVRAFLSGVRKKAALTKEERGDGTTAYRLLATNSRDAAPERSQ